MRSKLTALALAVMLAISGSGLVAADVASTDGAQAIDNTNTTDDEPTRLTADESFKRDSETLTIFGLGSLTQLTANESSRIDGSVENITTDGTIHVVDGSESETNGINVVDENDELNATELDQVRTLVSNDDEASEQLSDRFGNASVTLSVHGINPSGDVHMDATAPGDNPETVVVAGLSDDDVSVEAAALLSADSAMQVDLDRENYSVQDAT